MMGNSRSAMNRTYRAILATCLTLAAPGSRTVAELRADTARPIGERDGQIER
jgi:hypothetical protein